MEQCPSLLLPVAPPLLSCPNHYAPLDPKSWFSGEPLLTTQLALVHSTCHTVHPSIITHTFLSLVIGFHVVSPTHTPNSLTARGTWPCTE